MTRSIIQKSILSIAVVTASLIFTDYTLAATINWEKTYGGKINYNNGKVLEENNYFGTFSTAPWNDMLIKHSDGTIILKANPGAPIKSYSFRSYLLNAGGKQKATILNNPSAFIETADKGIVAIKTSGSYKSVTHTLVKYKNTTFKPVWSTVMKSTDQKNSITETESLAMYKNNYIVAGLEYVPGENWGNQVVIWKYNATGKLVWSKSMTTVDDNARVNTVIVLDDGTIVVGGNKDNSQNSESSWLLATNQAGDKLWEKAFGCSETVGDITVNNEGNLLVSSNARTNFSTNPQVWNSETTRMLWSTRLTLLSSADGKNIDERIIQGSFPTDTLTDSCSGVQITPNNLVTDPISFKTNSIMKTSDNGFLLVGTQSTNIGPYGKSTDQTWVRKLDTNLNQTWEQIIISSDNQYGANATETSSGQYIISGVKMNGQRTVRMISEF